MVGALLRIQLANQLFTQLSPSWNRESLGQMKILKDCTLWITTNYGKFLKRWEYQTNWLASWEICMQVKKQQWELDTEQQTGSK